MDEYKNQYHLNQPVTRKIHQGKFKLNFQHPSTQEQMQGLGDVKLTYRGGGKWTIFYINPQTGKSELFDLEISKSGELWLSDNVNRKFLTSIPLGLGEVPERHTSVDLIQHCKDIANIISDIIKEQIEKTLKGLRSVTVSLEFVS